MPKKKVDPLKAKERKQKIFVAVGAAVLLLVFAFEAKSLGLIGGKKAATAAPVTAPAGTPTTPNSLTPPGLPGTTPAPTGTTGGGSGLVDTDVPVSTSEGQLVSFDVFETKNPFAPQVHDESTTASAPAADTATADAGGSTAADTAHADVPAPGATVTPPTAAPAGVTPPAGETTTPTTTPTPTTTGPSTTTTTPTTPAQAPRKTVTISINGRSERVAEDGTFPSGAPVFRLVSFGKGAAEIGIVGGSYQTGDQTLTLERGKPVTLMNTSDGKRYKLELVSTP
jgi:hypothetical protein